MFHQMRYFWLVGGVGTVGGLVGRELWLMNKPAKSATQLLKLCALMRGSVPLDVKLSLIGIGIHARKMRGRVNGAVLTCRVADMMPGSARLNAVCPRGGRVGLRAEHGVSA